MEIWKEIKDYEGLYDISNLGRVKSLAKYVNNSKGTLNYNKERILCNVKKNGYYKIKLCKEGKIKTLLVHRLIAIAFIPNLENKPFINHINGIRDDNRIKNLEWCTPKENSTHAVRIGLSDYKGEKNHKSKLTEDNILEIRKIGKTKYYKDIAIDFNISPSTVGSILNNKTWKHI
jgi:hypothetical protein